MCVRMWHRTSAHTQAYVYTMAGLVMCGGGGICPAPRDAFPDYNGDCHNIFFLPPPSGRPSPATYSIVSRSSTIYIRLADRPALTAEVAASRHSLHHFTRTFLISCDSSSTNSYELVNSIERKNIRYRLCQCKKKTRNIVVDRCVFARNL